MGNIGDAISTSVPQVNDPETTASQAATDLLDEFKTRLTSKVTPSEMSIDATLDMNTNALENVTTLEFITQVSSPGDERVYTKSVSGVDELFYQDSGSQEVQITDNGSLNVAATGGISGAGYGSGGVEINWNSAGTNYQFKDGAGADDYAAVTCDPLQLRDGSGYTLTVDAPSMSADYTMQLPAALPSNDGAILTMSSAGVGAFEETSVRVEDGVLAVRSAGTLGGDTGVSAGGTALRSIITRVAANGDPFVSFGTMTDFTPTVKVNAVSETIDDKACAVSKVGHLLFFSIRVKWEHTGTDSGVTLTVDGLPAANQGALTGDPAPGVWFPVSGRFADNAGSFTAARAKLNPATGQLLVVDNHQDAASTSWNFTSTDYSLNICGMYEVTDE